VVDTPRKDREAARNRTGSKGAATRTVFSLSEEETVDLGRVMGRGMRGGELLVLQGPLGTGKTVFVRGLAAGLGIPLEDVSSPTFALIHEHSGGRLKLYHVDLYRIEDANELQTLGLDELCGAGSVVAVEWGERLPPFYRKDAIAVRLHDVGEGSRRIEIGAVVEEHGPRGDA
jgi:tRNA threonylcarbamoyladenosine biosynthesis protein TsaE